MLVVNSFFLLYILYFRRKYNFSLYSTAKLNKRPMLFTGTKLSKQYI